MPSSKSSITQFVPRIARADSFGAARKAFEL